jgi:hypothetical protein
MTIKEAELLRQRIAELEREMMDFRSSMARVLAGLYQTVHDLESSATMEPNTGVRKRYRTAEGAQGLHCRAF